MRGSEPGLWLAAARRRGDGRGALRAVLSAAPRENPPQVFGVDRRVPPRDPQLRGGGRACHRGARARAPLRLWANKPTSRGERTRTHPAGSGSACQPPLPAAPRCRACSGRRACCASWSCTCPRRRTRRFPAGGVPTSSARENPTAWPARWRSTPRSAPCSAVRGCPPAPLRGCAPAPRRWLRFVFVFCLPRRLMGGCFPLAKQAGDTLERVKVYCQQGKLDTAVRLAEESGDKASLFCVARQQELGARVAGLPGCGSADLRICISAGRAAGG